MQPNQSIITTAATCRGGGPPLRLLGMSTDYSSPVTPAPSTSNPRRSRWANRCAVLATLLVVLGPLGFIYTRAEIASWYAARAMNAVWDEKYAAAIEHYDRALAWDAEDAGYLVLRAEALLELDRNDEALKDSRRAAELAPDNSFVLQVYTTALVRTGQAAEAAKLYEDRLPYLGIYDDRLRALLQNNIAFILATANLDIERAKKHIDEALEYEPDNLSYIDTRAMVFYRQGEHEKALADMQRALRSSTQLLSLTQTVAADSSIDQRHRSYNERKGRYVWAQMLYHRALVHEALAAKADGDDAKRIAHQIQAVTDRQKIRELGFTPSEKLF